MIEEQPRHARIVALAVVTSFALIAAQVSGKAARDALFLSSHDVTLLPPMILGTALASILVALVAAKGMQVATPARFSPAALLASAALFVAEWALGGSSPARAAILIYLHTGALLPVLVSGFWSQLGDHFDPRSSRRHVSRILAAGTLGGIAGAVLAERLAATWSPTSALPVLGGLHLVCAALTWRIGGRGAAGPPPSAEAAGLEELASASGPTPPSIRDAPADSGLRAELGALWRTSYLRDLALLLVLVTVGLTLVDYQFKVEATARFHGADTLMRFLAAFYLAEAILAFVLQSTLGRRLLERLGAASLASVLPAALAIGGVCVPLVPGLTAAALAKGIAATIRHSWFRAGYEQLYSPISRVSRRAVKVVVDVAGDRLGDLLGAAALIGIAELTRDRTAIALIVIAVSAAAVVIARRLRHGYTGMLRDSMAAWGRTLEPTADTLQQTFFSGLEQPPTLLAGPGDHLEELRSGDPQRIRRALRSAPVGHAEAAAVIQLLAWDAVAADAIRALRASVERLTDQLLQVLGDAQAREVVRRRLPRVLAAGSPERVLPGLLAGLDDPGLAVRYQCARALARISERRGGLPEVHDRVLAAVSREIEVGRSLRVGHQALEELPGDEASPFAHDYLRQRGHRTLQHIFTLLAIVLPQELLIISYKGLMTDDGNLRGTAIEYLECVLPAGIWSGLSRVLELRDRPRRSARSAAEIIEDLKSLSDSIRVNLERARSAEPPGGAR